MNDRVYPSMALLARKRLLRAGQWIGIVLGIMLLGAACSRPFPDDGLMTVTLLSLLSADSATSPDAEIKKIFVSNTKPAGNTGGPTGADTLCNNDSNKPDSATYKAMLVDGTNRTACVNANCTPAAGGDGLDWVFQANTTYYRDNGGTWEALLTTNANRIATFPLEATGFHSSALSEWWTGLDVDWRVAFAGVDLDCADWTGGVNGQTGIGGSNTADAISFGTPSCAIAATYSLVCVGQ